MINKLTKTQEEAIIPFREKWIDRILRTEQTDEEIKNNIKQVHEREVDVFSQTVRKVID